MFIAGTAQHTCIISLSGYFLLFCAAEMQLSRRKATSCLCTFLLSQKHYCLENYMVTGCNSWLELNNGFIQWHNRLNYLMFILDLFSAINGRKEHRFLYLTKSFLFKYFQQMIAFFIFTQAHCNAMFLHFGKNINIIDSTYFSSYCDFETPATIILCYTSDSMMRLPLYHK